MSDPNGKKRTINENDGGGDDDDDEEEEEEEEEKEEEEDGVSHSAIVLFENIFPRYVDHYSL